MSPDNILDSLRSVRRRLRVLLTIDGANRLISAALVTFGAAVVLDWWVHFPALFRVGVGAAFAAWASLWFVRRICRPLFAPISLDQMALTLGRLTPDYRDRLASAVAYLDRGADGAPALWDRVLTNTVRSAARVPPSRAVSARRPLRSTMVSLALIAATVGAYVLAPAMLEIGWQRFTVPFGPTAWPRRVEIEPLTGDATVAFGESVTIEMRLKRGDNEALRGFLTARSPHAGDASDVRRVMMRRDADGVYRRRLEGMRADLTYGLSAGDDNTVDRPFHIRVVHRPAVKSARFVFSPPAYAGGAAHAVRSLDDARASAVRGSRARLELVVTKPPAIRTDGTSEAELVFDDGRSMRLDNDPDDATALFTEFTAVASLTFRVRMLDRDGLESRNGATYRLDVRPDAAPSVEFLRPTGSVEATPTGRVDLAVTAGDDFGIESLLLTTSIHGAEHVVADLLESETAGPSSDRRRLDASHEWDLSELHLSPGDALECVAVVRDNYRSGDETHPPVRSNPVRIQIISESALASSLGQDLIAAKRGLLDMLAAVESALAETQSVAAGPAGGHPLDDRGRAAIEGVANDLQRTTVEGRSIQRRMKAMVRRAAQNRAERLDAAQQATRLSQRIRRLTTGPLARAVTSLTRATESREAGRQDSGLSASADRQREVADAIREMVREIDQWNDFDAVARKVRDLLDRQEALARDVDRLGRTTAGRSREQLEPGPRMDLTRAAAGQTQLGRESADLLEKMAVMAKELARSDRPTSESLNRARDIGIQRAVVQQMIQAAESIRANRANQARSFQMSAARVLRNMLAALAERPQRALAELSRRIADLLARLERVIAAQQDLLASNRALRTPPEASPGMDRLAVRQDTLRNTTRSMADEIKATSEAAAAARQSLNAASAAMAQAADRLRTHQSEPAEERQQAAMASLHQAVERLRTLRQEAEQALGTQSLAAIRDGLKQIRQNEVALREETAGIDVRRTEQRRMSRIDGLRLNRMANEQRGLIKRLEAVKRKMLQSVVVRFICGRIATQMASAAEALASHDCGPATARQDGIIRSLNRLLEAIEEETQNEEQAFAAAGGGNGMTSPTRARPIPTLAELKMLRMMQADVNEQTQASYRIEPDPILRTERQLKTVESIGTSQREIRDLAVEMIRKAAASQAGGER